MSDWLKKLRIGIVGNGVVGQAVARSYLEHVGEVRCWDLLEERSTHDLGLTLSSDIVFVCLPSPQENGGLGCDLRAIDGFFHDRVLNGVRPHGDANYVLRSTVPIGTTKRLAEKYGLTNLVHSPEFLTARCATVDAQIPTRNIIGVTTEEYGVAEDGVSPDAWCKVRDLYLARFPGVPLFTMRSDESEAVKLFQNSFFSCKLSFWNEVKCLSDKLSLDWDAVLNGVLSDGRIHPSHTKVPGPDGRPGWGGPCLPKDVASLISLMDFVGVDAPVIKACYERNKEDRKR